MYHYRSDTLRIVATVAPSNGPQGALLAGVLDGELRILGSGLAGGDEDGDGVLDAVDVCPQAWNPRQIDDDRDGLGEKAGSDEGCDPTPCSDLRPPSSLQVRTSLGDPAGAAKAALAYLEARVCAARQCMAAKRDDPAADLDALCLGSFAGDAETPRLRGSTEKTEKKEMSAERALLDVLAGSHAKGRGASVHFARQVIRAYGEAANAIARATATAPTSTIQELLSHARSMHACATSRITKGTTDLKACFGALVDGVPPQPWARTPADCVTWRRSVLAAATLLGDPTIPSIR